MKIIQIDPGRVVVCDNCSADYTDSTESGGIVSMERAICPICAPGWTGKSTECPGGMSFSDWIRSVRQVEGDLDRAPVVTVLG